MTRTLAIILVAGLWPGLAHSSAQADSAVATTPDYVWLGPQLSGDVRTSASGDGLFGLLGAHLLSLQTTDRSWFKRFDASLSAQYGTLVNQHPYTTFAGGRGAIDYELGHRFLPPSTWSPYLSGRAAVSLQVMWHPGLSIAALNTINSSDGVGGTTLDGALRLSAGVSFLAEGYSLLLTVFAQETLQAPRVVAAGAAFNEFGLALRSDGARSYAVGVEVLGGLGFRSTNEDLGFTQQSFRYQVAGWGRKMFENGLWMGLSVSWSRDRHRQVYLPSTLVFNSVQAPTVVVALNVGFALWRNP